ncbi:hypothetical protein A2U01_0050448, partial [Trifolium medium]|nr:hypothetical protein [Trifolium medium]
FNMADIDESVDGGVDSNDVRSSDGHTYDDEESNYSISSGHDTGNDDDDESDDDDD